ncbi:hypothetical protein VE04_08633 [Pseudogymnoascus sp. 24MN13]|nr:hypothetical protein VE04_08633 [Pseudogymnoascus sp. 24MN13]
MVRKLKHHESKLLRKVDFTTYASDNNHRDAAVLRRYAIQNPSDYQKYNRICGSLRQLAHKLAALPPDDRVRETRELYFSISSMIWGFSRRHPSYPRWRIVLPMAQAVHAPTKIVEQGHVRVGTEAVTDPAYLVGKSMEDFVTWVDGSKIRRNILKYREKLDDFDLL